MKRKLHLTSVRQISPACEPVLNSMSAFRTERKALHQTLLFRTETETADCHLKQNHKKNYASAEKSLQITQKTKYTGLQNKYIYTRH